MQKVFPISIDEAKFIALQRVKNTDEVEKGIQIVDPEFSSVCPLSGLPDFGRVVLQYVPQKHCVELKSYKLFLRSFYGVGCFHENCTQRIITAFVEAIEPKWCRITIDWGARGGLHTTTQMNWSTADGYTADIRDFAHPMFTKQATSWDNQ